MFLISGACCFLMTEVSPRSKGAAFKAGWCWSEPGRSLLTCGKGFITRLGFRLCPADAWVPPCSLGRGCSGVGPITAPLQTPPLLGGGRRGWQGAIPSTPYTDPSSQTCWKQLPSNSFFLVRPSHASCWRVAEWKLTLSE